MKQNIALAVLSALLLVMGVVLTAPTMAQQPVDGGTPDGTVVTDTGPGGEKDVTIEDLVKASEKAADDWKTEGWIAGIAGVISVLLLALRFKPLNRLLENKGLKWIKPYAALGLGALLGFFSSFASGASIGKSIVAGLIAGILSPGIHLLLTKGNTK